MPPVGLQRGKKPLAEREAKGKAAADQPSGSHEAKGTAVKVNTNQPKTVDEEVKKSQKSDGSQPAAAAISTSGELQNRASGTKHDKSAVSAGQNVPVVKPKKVAVKSSAKQTADETTAQSDQVVARKDAAATAAKPSKQSDQVDQKEIVAAKGSKQSDQAVAQKDIADIPEPQQSDQALVQKDAAAAAAASAKTPKESDQMVAQKEPAAVKPAPATKDAPPVKKQENVAEKAVAITEQSEGKAEAKLDEKIKADGVVKESKVDKLKATDKVADAAQIKTVNMASQDKQAKPKKAEVTKSESKPEAKTEIKIEAKQADKAEPKLAGETKKQSQEIVKGRAEVEKSANLNAEKVDTDTTEFNEAIKKYNDLSKQQLKKALEDEKKELLERQTSALSYYDGTRDERVKQVEEEMKLMAEFEEIAKKKVMDRK